jgi:hypothetical protein
VAFTGGNDVVQQITPTTLPPPLCNREEVHGRDGFSMVSQKDEPTFGVDFQDL